MSYYCIFVHGHSSDDGGKTPLLCAAESGHDKVVAYLLTFEKVQADLKNQPEKVASPSVSYDSHFSPKLMLQMPVQSDSQAVLILGCSRYDRSFVKASYCDIITDQLQESPLLVAAQNGHTRCVMLLLQNEANVLQRDYKGRNCLMLAIQYHHRYGDSIDMITSLHVETC